MDGLFFDMQKQPEMPDQIIKKVLENDVVIKVNTHPASNPIKSVNLVNNLKDYEFYVLFAKKQHIKYTLK